jgi:hypothetical protein
VTIPGPSRRIVVEPLEQPAPAKPVTVPAQDPPPERRPAPEREPEPARAP